MYVARVSINNVFMSPCVVVPLFVASPLGRKPFPLINPPLISQRFRPADRAGDRSNEWNAVPPDFVEQFAVSRGTRVSKYYIKLQLRPSSVSFLSFCIEQFYSIVYDSMQMCARNKIIEDVRPLDSIFIKKEEE